MRLRAKNLKAATVDAPDKYILDNYQSNQERRKQLDLRDFLRLAKKTD